VPVIIGGTGPQRTPAIAARFASEYNIGFNGEAVIAERFAAVDAACTALDRDPSTLKHSVVLPTFAGATEADLRRRAAARGLEYDPADPVNIVGGADAIVEKVGRLRELGAERVYFQLMDIRDLAHFEYLGAEALPHLPR
jgi:alkanesulfonate monooxygenase SsuD/methylene tetrahydromethanopterin reductase-like flavin-dependent oxidoreductase (luciferase family)